VGGEDDVPAGIAGDGFGQHLLIAFVGAVADADSALALEALDHGRVDVGRPVVDVEAGAGVAGAGERGGSGCEEDAAVHFSCNLWEMRIRTPNATTMKAETAFTTGLTPRRAMA
jgi:hypothetical protein